MKSLFSLLLNDTKFVFIPQTYLKISYDNLNTFILFSSVTDLRRRAPKIIRICDFGSHNSVRAKIAVNK